MIAAAPAASRAAADALRAATPHSLVALVGFGSAVDAELDAGLQRLGIKGLRLADIDRALEAAGQARFDAVVVRLDDSVSAAVRRLADWRARFACPLLVLAHLEDEIDEILALELGADGVLAQPVSPRRLRAHLMMLLRRPAGLAVQAPVPALAGPARTLPAANGGWSVDRVRNRLQRGAAVIQLTEMQALLAQLLLDEAGRVVPRAALLAAVGGGRAMQPRTVDVYVSRLRSRLIEARVEGLAIEAVRGRGYTAVVASQPVLAWSAGAL